MNRESADRETQMVSVERVQNYVTNVKQAFWFPSFTNYLSVFSLYKPTVCYTSFVIMSVSLSFATDLSSAQCRKRLCECRIQFSRVGQAEDLNPDGSIAIHPSQPHSEMKNDGNAKSGL